MQKTAFTRSTGNFAGVVLRLLVKNIFDKKLRTFLIVFSILLSTTLFFCSMTIGGTLVNIYTDQIKKQIGTADIVVAEGERPEYKYFSMEPAMTIADKVEYIIDGVIGHGYYNGNAGEKTVDLYGIDLNDLQTFNPIQYAVNHKDEAFEGNKVIISSPFSEETGLSLGDEVTFKIEDKQYTFDVYAISYPVGPFTNDTQSLQAVMPKDTYASIVNAKNDDVRIICMKLKNIDDKEVIIRELSGLYPNNSVREAISQRELDQRVGTLSVSFIIIAVVVFLLSAFIILSSFQVIVLERLPLLGTFRSIGVTKSMTNGIMLLESVLYSIFGGALGCLGGVGILYYLSRMMSPAWLEVKAEFTPVHIIVAFASAIVLSLAASIAPIIKASKISIKDIVLNSFSAARPKNRHKFFLGILLVMLRIILPVVVPYQMGMMVNTLCLVITVIGVVLLTPYLLEAGVSLFEKINPLVFGNEGAIAAMNLRRNKSMLGSVTLLTIGIASLLMINVVTSSVLNGMAGVFTDISAFHVYTSPNQRNDTLEKDLYSILQITAVYSFYTALGVFVPDKNDEISVIEDIDPEKYLNHMNITFDDGKNTLKELEDGRNILVSSVVRNKMDLKEGDTLTLNMEAGNIDYTIIGFFDSTIYGSNYAMVSAQNLKEDMQMEHYSFMYIKCTGSAIDVAEQIKQRFPDRFKDVYTIEELIENDRKNNGMVFYLLNAFSILSMLIGIFGVVNNLIVNFMERRRWIAMMKSIGMSKGQIIKMIFVESLTGGVIGGIIGVLTGLSMILLIPNIMLSMGLVYTIKYSLPLLLMYLFISVLIMIVASISPAIKSSKLNVIEAIKYE